MEHALGLPVVTLHSYARVSISLEGWAEEQEPGTPVAEVSLQDSPDLTRVAVSDQGRVAPPADPNRALGLRSLGLELFKERLQVPRVGLRV